MVPIACKGPCPRSFLAAGRSNPFPAPPPFSPPAGSFGECKAFPQDQGERFAGGACTIWQA